MNELHLHYTAISHQTSEGDGEPWGDRGTTHTDYIFQNICTLSRPSGLRTNSEALSVGFEPVKGKMYFFVVCVYDTGDSFGWDSNGGMEALEVFEEYDEARAFEAFLLNGDEPKDNYYIPYGEKQYHLPWWGYFEQLSYIEVVPATLVGS